MDCRRSCRRTRPGARIATGTISVSGTNILTLNPTDLLKFRGGRAAMVPQNPLSSLTPHLTIAQHLTELIRLHRADHGKHPKERAIELLGAMELPDPAGIYDRYPSSLQPHSSQSRNACSQRDRADEPDYLNRMTTVGCVASRFKSRKASTGSRT
jgi:ABC-type dipeptide/oligopeptide/nickel transport system ATPase component